MQKTAYYLNSDKPLFVTDDDLALHTIITHGNPLDIFETDLGNREPILEGQRVPSEAAPSDLETFDQYVQLKRPQAFPLLYEIELTRGKQKRYVGVHLLVHF
jgi:hypothetical protein